MRSIIKIPDWRQSKGIGLKDKLKSTKVLILGEVERSYRF